MRYCGKTSIALVILFSAISQNAFAAHANEVVNPQITDVVTQANVKVLGDAPAVAEGNVSQASAQALSNAAHNATSAQQNSNTILQATTTQGVALLYGEDTSSNSVSTHAIYGNSGHTH